MKIELDKTNTIINIARMVKLFIISLLMVVSLGASEYSIVKGSFTWNEARKDAEARGGDLAVISSPAISKKIENLFTARARYYWIGATDEGTEGTWRWVNKDIWDFDNWLIGEPNNLGGYQGEHYGIVFSGASQLANTALNNKWLDGVINCRTDGYILEIKAKTSLPETIKPSANTLYSLIQAVAPGFSMISVPFSYQDNNVSTIFNSSTVFGALSDIVLYDYNYFGGWVVNSYDSEFEGWAVPNHVIHAGTAIWILNNAQEIKYIKFRGYQPSMWRETHETFIP